VERIRVAKKLMKKSMAVQEKDVPEELSSIGDHPLAAH
jgi:hypothetical protein